MKLRSLLSTVALSASLLVPLAGCGTEQSQDSAVPNAQVPSEELAAPEQRESRERAASEETRAALGIRTWRMLEPVDGRARFEGVDAQGRVLLSAVTSPTPEGYILDVTAPAPMSFRVDASFRLLEGDASQPVFAALHRDLLVAPAGTQAQPALDISEFDITRADHEAMTAGAGQVGAFATDAQRVVYRQRLSCHVQYATEAYNSVDGRPAVCGLYYMRSLSTDVMKVWMAEDPEAQTHFITVGFAGTNPTNFGDILRDLESQLYLTHVSPLNPSFPYGTMLVGMGWEQRWRIQAATGLATYLGNAAATNLARGWKMTLVVTGHSLGAVTATLAGFDMTGLLAQSGVTHRVAVTAFNPPRLGYSSSRNEYQQRLFTDCNIGEFSRNQPCIILRQMARDYDPVHTLPLNMVHPIWQLANNANRGVGPGPYGTNALLPYCPQYQAPHRSLINFVDNHNLAAWMTDIANMPNNHLDCMYLPN